MYKSIFLGVFLCLWCLIGSASELPDTIDRIRSSVVSIGLLRPEKNTNSAAKGPRHEYRGTGFAIGDGYYIVTNYHVIPDDLGAEENASLAVFFGRGQRVRGFKAEVVRFDKDHDLALLKIAGGPLPAMSLSSRSDIREGEDVAFTGYPLGMVLGMYPVTSKGIVSAITPIVIPATSSRRLTAAQIRRMKTPFEVYQLDAIAYPGNSGSPVYDPKTGEVLGVINSVFVKNTKEAVLSDPSGISYAIPVKYVKELLSGE